MSKKVVAYFSASGVTAKAAAALAEAAGADLVEIKPAVPYTPADLDWKNPQSRSSVEMKDPASRPALAAGVGGLEGYDTVFVGFPIWWGTAPTVVNTFLDGCDLTGKTVVPFATSGGTGIEKAAADLAGAYKGNFLPGKRLSATDTAEWLKVWLTELGL